MSSHLNASQNRIRLIIVFLFTVLLALTFYIFKDKLKQGSAMPLSHAEVVDESMFMGLRHATPSEIKTILPQAVGKPTLLDFKSRLCHDCKRLAPIVQQAVSQHPNVYFKEIDVLDDAKKYPALFRTFKPVSVPVLVFISPRGEIKNVLYNYQKPGVIEAALNKLDSHPKKAPTHKP